MSWKKCTKLVVGLPCNYHLAETSPVSPGKKNFEAEGTALLGMNSSENRKKSIVLMLEIQMAQFSVAK